MPLFRYQHFRSSYNQALDQVRAQVLQPAYPGSKLKQERQFFRECFARPNDEQLDLEIKALRLVAIENAFFSDLHLRGKSWLHLRDILLPSEVAWQSSLPASPSFSAIDAAMDDYYSKCFVKAEDPQDLPLLAGRHFARRCLGFAHTRSSVWGLEMYDAEHAAALQTFQQVPWPPSIRWASKAR